MTIHSDENHRTSTFNSSTNLHSLTQMVLLHKNIHLSVKAAISSHQHLRHKSTHQNAWAASYSQHLQHKKITHQNVRAATYSKHLQHKPILCRPLQTPDHQHPTASPQDHRTAHIHTPAAATPSNLLLDHHAVVALHQSGNPTRWR